MQSCPTFRLKIPGHFFGNHTLQRAGNKTKTNNDRRLIPAAHQCLHSGTQIANGGIHFFLKKTTFLGQADISSHLFKQHDTNFIFQTPDGGAERGLRNTQPGSSNCIMLHLCQNREIPQMIIIHRENLFLVIVFIYR